MRIFDHDPSILVDRLSLYFASDRSDSFGQTDLWQVPVIPFADFSGPEGKR